MLHASASRLAKNNERVAIYTQNFADAPHASVPTGRKQRKGHHLRPEFRGRSRRQHHDAAKTTRRSPLTPGISQTLHASASQGAKNNERVATYALNFEDAPRASVATRQKQREVPTNLRKNMRTFEGPRQGARFFFLLRARPGLTHSRFFLWKCFFGSAPERRTAHRTKKKHVQCAFFFLLRAQPGLTHSRFFLWKCFIGSAPERRTAHRTKKKHVQCAFFVLLPARPGLTHSRFFLWKCFIGSAPERRTAHRTKKKHVQCAFFFCSPCGPGSLTHLFRSSNIINVGNRKRNARGTKKNRKWHAYGAKKKMRVPMHSRSLQHIGLQRTLAFETWSPKPLGLHV